MIWTDATGNRKALDQLESSHLINIAKMARNKLFETAFNYAHGYKIGTAAYQRHAERVLRETAQEHTKMNGYVWIMAQVNAVLYHRKETIPTDISHNLDNLTRMFLHGTPDTKFPGVIKKPQLNLKNKKLKEAVAKIKEERKPPSVRSRGIMDFFED
jgi:hypothetical protein